MVRGIHTRKRSAGRFVRRTKRRRTVRRRRTGRNGRTTTSRASGATSVGTFRTRRTSVRRWRNMLWQDTIAKTHYRSVIDRTVNFATPNDLINATLSVQSALPLSFWTTAGGTKPVDVGVLVPTFSGDITLRGGIARVAVTNRVNPVDTTPSDPVRITIYAVWTDSNTSAFVLPAATQKTMWDPSLEADFTKFGKVQFKRETILKGDGESVQCYFKYKPQKIDQAVFNGGGHQLVWFILASQMSNTETTPTGETVDVVLSHNISFSADAQ